MIDNTRFHEIVSINNKFILTTHINPDGDAIGSELALAYFLKKLGKEVSIINHSFTPQNFLFLDVENKIEKYAPEKHDFIIKNADVLVALDFNRIDRIKSMVKIFQESKAYKIIIDHHQNPGDFADQCFCDTDYSATGEIIYDLIKSFDPNLIDKKTADAVYSAIMTDTGSFRFNRVTPKVHLVIADLISRGANPTELYNKIYNEITFAKLKLLGESITNIKTIFDGKIAYMVITRKMLEDAEAQEEDVDGFVNFCLSISGVQIGILFFELYDGVKASLRSRNNFAVNKLAEKFGGGGHLNAAGIRFWDSKLDEIIPKLLNQTQMDLTEYERVNPNDKI
ncbi:MAG: bifunctional oligoribonuclease/PAP phosphatase NrnA [Ignavibacteria bacterium]|nr:bifunctional oligoribonuclease/PAP phosphatase NrnA [Ignavibacteria bacterium]